MSSIMQCINYLLIIKSRYILTKQIPDVYDLIEEKENKFNDGWW